MTTKESLEKGFNAARKEWDEGNGSHADYARFLFYAGAQFGIKCSIEIEERALRTPFTLLLEDVDETS